MAFILLVLVVWICMRMTRRRKRKDRALGPALKPNEGYDDDAFDFHDDPNPYYRPDDRSANLHGGGTGGAYRGADEKLRRESAFVPPSENQAGFGAPGIGTGGGASPYGAGYEGGHKSRYNVRSGEEVYPLVQRGTTSTAEVDSYGYAVSPGWDSGYQQQQHQQQHHPHLAQSGGRGDWLQYNAR